MTLELHITYRCDLACFYCNRGCRIHTHHTPDLSLGHFNFFLQSVPEPIKKIVLIGGEPTLHPDVIRFAIRSLEVAQTVQIYSNNHHPTARATLKALESIGVSVFEGTYKTESIQHGMQTMFISPRDLGIDRQIPCSWAACAGHCGYSVDAYGITACSCGGAIDGLLRLGLRTWDWAPVLDGSQLKQLCRHCGANWNFKDEDLKDNLVEFRGQKMTRSWCWATLGQLTPHAPYRY